MQQGQQGQQLSEVVYRSFEKPDETREPNRAKIEIVRLNNYTASRFFAQPGWRWSKDMKDQVREGQELCQLSHIGYVLAGTLCIESKGQKCLIPAGNAYEIPPGHDACVEGNEGLLLVEFESRPGQQKQRGGQKGLEDVSQQH